MDLDVAKKIIQDTGLQRALKEMDDATEAALAEMKKNIGSMSDYSSGFIGEYKRDGKAADDAWAEFNGEVTKITVGKAKDGKAAMAAYKRWMTTLEILETQNTRYAAFVDAKVAGVVAIMLATLNDVTRRLGAQSASLEQELVAVKKAIEKARSELAEAEAQRILNVAITAVSLVLPVSGTLAKLVSVGTFSLQTTLDVALGPSKPSMLGVSNTAVGDLPTLLNTARKQIRQNVTRFAGIVSGISTLILDNEEVDAARKVLSDLHTRLERVQGMLVLLDRLLVNDAVHLMRLHNDALKTISLARSRAEAYRSLEGKRSRLLKELAKIK